MVSIFCFTKKEKNNMLRIKIELVPHGVESQATIIQEIKIWNDLSGTPEFENYGYSSTETLDTMHWDNYKEGIFGWTESKGYIKHFDRTKTVKELLALVLKNLEDKKHDPRY
jgi:hypothetical protein